MLAGKTNGTALMVGAGTLAVILLLKGSKRVPGILIAVVGATVVVGALDLAARADVSVLGPSRRACLRSPSRGSPMPISSRPDRWARRRPGLVRRHQRALAHLRGADRTHVDPNQEMVGLVPPTWPPDSFRAFPSAAVRHAPPWPRPRGPEPS